MATVVRTAASGNNGVSNKNEMEEAKNIGEEALALNYEAVGTGAGARFALRASRSNIARHEIMK